MNMYPNSQIQPGDIPLDIRSDPIFKAVFTKEVPAAKGALSNLVSALIGRKVVVISILANEQPIDGLGDRKLRYDIKCKAEDGELINVEMGLNTRAYEPLRMEFHTGRLYTTQEISGKGKTYKHLKETYHISILAKRSFFNDGVFLHTFKYYDPEHKISLNGRTRIITLELCKLEGIVEKPADELSPAERWAVFFEYLTDEGRRDKINEIVKFEEGIAMANEVLMTISADEKERYRLLDEESQLMTYYSDLEEAMDEGLEKGEAIGLEKGEAIGLERKSREIAQNMKGMGFSAEQILSVTGVELNESPSPA